MKTLKLKTSPGDSFDEVARKAKEFASKEPYTLTKFDFNEVECLVSKDTNLDLLYRDYSNAFIMDWKVVGPDCSPKYPESVAQELKRRQDAREAEMEKRRIEQEKKDNAEKAEFESKTKGIELDIIDQDKWNKEKEINKDPYGSCIFNYAESWGKLMQAELFNGVPISKSYEKTSYQLGFFGITGFMYGAAVATLAKHWRHGDELRRAHNKEYGHNGDGVVNPAILTIGR